MKLIVGLGNPGKAYSNTKHNVGFRAVDLLAQRCGVNFKKSLGACWISAKAKIDNVDIILAKPLTFMNLSGRAAEALVRKHHIDLEDLLVVCDDLDLEFGRIKIRPAGSSSGHRGIQSIIEALGSSKFSRLRIGIGRPLKGIDAADYVLSAFSKKEDRALNAAIERGVDCIQKWVSEGIDKAMNEFNKYKYHNKGDK